MGADLDCVAADFIHEIAQDAAGAGVAAINKALTHVAAQARAVLRAKDESRARAKLVATVQRLNWEAQGRLWLKLCEGRTEVEVLAPTDWSAFTPEQFIGAAAAAHVSSRGPRRDRALLFAVARLVLIFENETGLGATHSPFKNSVYEGPPQSRVGQFIQAFFEMAERVEFRPPKGYPPLGAGRKAKPFPHVEPTLLSSALGYGLPRRRDALRQTANAGPVQTP